MPAIASPLFDRLRAIVGPGNVLTAPSDLLVYECDGFTIEKNKPEWFGMIKGLSVAGMFAMPSRGGNRNKAGWKLIGFKDQFSWKAPYGWYDAEGNQ